MKKLSLLLLLFASLAFGQVERMEPPFWWSGMNHAELQVMFYGKNIAQYSPSVSDGIVIKNVVKTENPNYLFVTIDTRNVPAREFTFSFRNSRNKVAFTKKYELKQRREGSSSCNSIVSNPAIGETIHK